MDASLKSRICNVSGFQIKDDLGKYLGVPILHKKVNRRSFNFVIDKVDQRLSNWKAKTLSLAGRLTLCKPVIQALPAYVMQGAWLPRSVCDVIDKRCHDFLWGDTDTLRRIHLVNWVKVFRPKAWGGLGLRSARNINQASLMKAGWHLLARRKDLWVDVFRAKYKCGSGLIPCIQKNRVGLNFWRGVCNAWEDMHQNIVWRIGMVPW